MSQGICSVPTLPPKSPDNEVQPYRRFKTLEGAEMASTDPLEGPCEASMTRRQLQSDSGNEFLPVEVLTIIFQLSRHTVEFALPNVVWTSLMQNPSLFGEIIAGAPVALTAVCRYWRSVAHGCPFLWSSIPLLLESDTILSLANPRQAKYHLQHSGKVPLTLAVGTRTELTGHGVKDEDTDEFQTFSLFAPHISRISELFLSLHSDPSLFASFCHPLYTFPILERLTIVGAASEGSALCKAGFLQSSSLRKVTWAVSERPPNALLTSLITTPNPNLTELILADSFAVVLSPTAAYAVLAAAPALVVFQCRLGAALQDEALYGRWPDASADPHDSLVPLEHTCLQKMDLTFQGTPESETTPELLDVLVCPALESFAFKLEWSASFEPASVTRWLIRGSHWRIAALECSTGVDLEELLHAVTSMPLLQSLKCIGARAVLIRGRVLVDQESFLGVLSGGEPEMNLANQLPCPFLRQLHLGYAYFTREGIEQFLISRVYGSQRDFLSGLKMQNPLESFRVNNFGEADQNAILAMRSLSRCWRRVHNVDVKVDRYINQHAMVVAGSDQSRLDGRRVIFSPLPWGPQVDSPF
ncbi:hypothetical protein FA13DRAFT_1721677 [Coprinellus micaceus]|uniref:Uncharacterized protein n=1 Tax=Coprinellus micaceus TaxID=71717 RepID=A0A4Y7RZ31_COPMI|nr:hypothetical protein FA13DRAFT_1721677 [Coprinellus micaceus]